ncbi:MAG: hypothetical protein JWP37_1072 [Mucilaginibacter sp.]|nr:hypothetical protein [Mucilaginibacter sp.]
MNLNHNLQITIKSKWLLLIACLGTSPVIVFCCFYLFSSYSYLAEWYLRMNNCFYQQAHWKDDFFTVHTKQQGNIFCAAGLIISIPLLYHLIRHFKKTSASLKLQFSKWNILIALLCILTGTAAWLWGYSLVHQGFDEAFSAVNCASLPPFQTLSYYMLPNNHILFNVLNGVLFHFAGDKVFTGKLISLVCFWGIIAVVFAWLSGIIKNKLLLAIATIVISLQFPIWGFGFEARGYELYSLAEWFSFFAIIKYVNTKNSQWLYYHALACISGYLCIPTFMYFHVAFLLFGLLWMIYTREPDAKFWRVQLNIILIAYLLYLPAICFSGIHALVGNPYVTGNIHTLQELYDKGIDRFTLYLNYYTSHFTADHSKLDWMLFLSPITLFCFYKNKLAVLCGLFYLAMWLTCIMLAYAMKIYALERTVSGHVSISLALTIYVLYLLLSKLNNVWRMPIIGDVVLMIFLVVAGINFSNGNKENVSMRLYDNDINEKYNLLMNEGISLIPKGSSIAFSEQCFYWYYQCKIRGDKVNKCSIGNEQYFVRFGSDLFPVSDPEKYVLIKTVFKEGVTAVGYGIYKRER